MSDAIRLNRPVHAARRDAVVERAVELLALPVDHLDIAGRIDHVRRIIRLLERALGEAELAVRGGGVPRLELEFTRFLRLLLDNVRSAAALLENQAQLESAESSFLRDFLGIPREEIELSAMNYRRLSIEVLAGLWQLLRLLHIPYSQLRRENRGEFDASQAERYESAYRAMRSEVAEAEPPPAPRP